MDLTTRADIEKAAARHAERLGKTTGRRVTTEIAENVDVAKAVLHRANDGRTEYVVMATRAAGAIGRALRGSVADRVMRESAHPVFLIPTTRSGGRGDLRLRRILVPVDGSPLFRSFR